MKEPLKHFLERTTFLGRLLRHRRFKRFEKKYLDWQKKGSVLPTPHFGKQQVVREYAEKFALSLFIETGTYTGHMIWAMLDQFESIFSIELDPILFEKARNRFAGYTHVHIMNGDSGELMHSMLKDIRKPCLFWLDAHWSGGKTAKGKMETPVVEELQCILSCPISKKHVLLIDDARCFTGTNDYPSLEIVKNFILKICPDWVFEVKDDIIRAHRREIEK